MSNSNIAVLSAIIGIVSCALSILTYVFQSIGLYSIAKRRGIKAPGLAWIPVGSNWILGSIADQFDYVRRGEKKSKRKTMLWLSIIIFIIALITIPLFISFITNVILYALMYGYDITPTDITNMMAPLMWMSILLLVLSILGIILTVIQYICLHKLYKSCSPGSATALTISSILFGIIIPFAIFALRKRDDGMYPEQIPANQQFYYGAPQNPQGYIPNQNPQGYNPYQNQQGYNPYQNQQNPQGFDPNQQNPQGYNPNQQF